MFSIWEKPFDRQRHQPNRRNEGYNDFVELLPDGWTEKGASRNDRISQIVIEAFCRMSKWLM
jgi:hypothetical protein